jgi:hypothetical protein
MKARKAMAKIHDRIHEDIEKSGAYYAWYKLRKGLYKHNRPRNMADCYKVMQDINFYIDPEAVDKAERMIKSEKSAMQTLNSFFSNI